jgi:hypothetical protein
MKKLILAIVFVSLVSLVGFVYAQTHDTSFDNKTVGSLTMDDSNSPGTVKIKPSAGMTTNYTVTVPAETGTIMINSAADISALIVSLKAIDVFYGSHSGVNWTSLGH